MSSEDTPPPYLMSRRNMLVASVSVAALAGGGLLTQGLWRRAAVEDAVVKVVQRLFGRDIATQSVLQTFAAFYVEQRATQGWMGPKERVIFTAAQDVSLIRHLADLVEAGGDRLAVMEDEIGQSFLRNTTMTYRSQGEPVEFSRRPTGRNTCNDPLARFGFDDD